MSEEYRDVTRIPHEGDGPELTSISHPDLSGRSPAELQEQEIALLKGEIGYLKSLIDNATMVIRDIPASVNPFIHTDLYNKLMDAIE